MSLSSVYSVNDSHPNTANDSDLTKAGHVNVCSREPSFSSTFSGINPLSWWSIHKRASSQTHNPCSVNTQMTG